MRILLAIVFSISLVPIAHSQVLSEKLLSDYMPCDQEAVYISDYPLLQDQYLIIANASCNIPRLNNPYIKTMIGLLDANFDTSGYTFTPYEKFWFSDYANPVDNSFYLVASNLGQGSQDSLYVGNVIEQYNHLEVNSYASFKPNQCTFEESDYYSGPESNIVLVNYKQGNCSNFKDASITCLDYNYNVKWEYKYQGVKNDELISIKKLEDKSILALGHSNSKFTNTNLFILSLDSNGMYKSTYHLPNSVNTSYANDMELDSSGNIYLAWNQGNRLHISKLDSAFNHKWTIDLNTYGLNNIELQFSEIDNSLVLISNGINPFNMDFEQLIHKIKVNGEIEWKRIFEERIADFIIKNDGSLILYADDIATNYTKIIHFDSTMAYYPIVDNDSTFIPNSDTTTNETVGVRDVKQSETSVDIFPNPFSEKLNIISENQMILNYQIFNLMGQLVSTDNPQSLKVQISFDKQVPGTYFIQLKLEDGSLKTEKIIYKY